LAPPTGSPSFSSSHLTGRLTVKAFVPLALALWIGPTLAAQTTADTTGIITTAHNYIDGWYANDGPRMESALHPHLAKRLVWDDSLKHSHLVDLTALELIQGTIHHPKGEGQHRNEVKILDIFGNVAMVRIDADTWVDYLQETRWNGKWVILNVMWENRPGM
jgi:Putative lumazine-binding